MYIIIVSLFFYVFAIMPVMAETLIIDTSVCAHVTEFQPGIDVHGKPVVPAEGPEHKNLKIADTIRIEVSQDLYKKLGIPHNPNNFQLEAKIGIITFDGTTITFNGQPIYKKNQSELIQLCQKYLPQ